MLVIPRRRLARWLGAGGVDVRLAVALVGTLVKWWALAFAAPAVAALVVGEPVWPFLVGGLVACACGLAAERLAPERGEMRPREGFLVVALVWTVVPLLACIPYLLDGGPVLSRPVDAYFEAVSGLTATGATVVADVDELGRAMLLWRQLTHWLGGLGIIVLAIAVLPRLRVGGRRLFHSELPGPTDLEPLDATIRETARRVWRVYVGLTLVGFALLAGLGWTGVDERLTPFDAFSYATSAASLGGFAVRDDSAAGLAAASQWVLCALMVVAGVNVLRLYGIVALRRIRAAVRDEELRLYLALLAIAATVLAIELLRTGDGGAEASIRHAAFQAVSVMTTTGLATADWTLWGPLATITLLALMFVGASAGSPTGSVKVVRHLMLFRLARRELEQAVHPDVVVPARISGRPVDDRALRSAVMFLVFYLLAFVVGAFALAIDAVRAGADAAVLDTLGAAAACLGNVGPAFGPFGPFGTYEAFSDFGTAVLTALMVLGRVEIIPIVVLLTRSYWRA